MSRPIWNYIFFILLALQLVFTIPSLAVEENTTEPLTNVIATESAEASQSTNPHKSIFEIIADWFGSLLDNFLAAKYQFSDTLDTGYGSSEVDTKYGDMTTRAIPDISRTEEKNKYIRQFIQGKYDDISIDPDKDQKKCNTTITLRELTLYLLNTNQSGIKTGLSEEEISNFLNSSETKKIELSQTEQCYQFLYDSLYMVPQGNTGKTAGSEQLNRSVGNILPNNKQSSINTCNNDTDDDCALKNKQAKTDVSKFLKPENPPDVSKFLKPENQDGDGFNMLRYQNQ